VIGAKYCFWVYLPQAGYTASVEQPERVNTAIIEFLNSL
jgi:hypothetical protein